MSQVLYQLLEIQKWPRHNACSQLDQSTGMIDVSSLGNNVDGRVTVLKDSIKNYN